MEEGKKVRQKMEAEKQALEKIKHKKLEQLISPHVLNYICFNELYEK